MATVGEAYVKIIPDASGFAAGLKSEVDGALKGIEDSVSGVGEKIKDEFEAPLEDTKEKVKGVGEEFKALGKLIGAAAVGRAVVNFAKDSIAAASDLSESINAVQVTFGDLSDEILAFSKNSATAVGLSSADFNSFAVRFAGFTKVIATGGKSAADVTTELTTRIADFASVMNLDLNEAATVFASTLAGESEAIRRFGIDMSAASIEAFALEKGLIASKDEMTAGIKVQATYAKLMQDTAQVAGDFANTSDGLANQQRILSAQFKDLQATVGAALIPVLQSLIGIMQPIFMAFTALPDPIQQVIALTAMLGAGFWAASTALRALGVSAAVANPLIAGVAAAVGLAVGIYTIFKRDSDRAKQAQEQFNQAMVKSNDPSIGLVNNLKRIVEEMNKLSPETEAAADGVDGLGMAIILVGDRLSASLPVLSEFGATLADVAGVLETGTDVFDDLTSSLEQLNLNAGSSTAKSFDQIAKALKNTIGEANPLYQTLLDLAKSGQMTNYQFTNLIRTLDGTADAFDQGREAANKANGEFLNSGETIKALSVILGEDVYLNLLKTADEIGNAAGRTDEWTYLVERLNTLLAESGRYYDPLTGKIVLLASAEGQAAVEANRLAGEIAGIEPVLEDVGYAWDEFVNKIDFEQASTGIRNEVKKIEEDYGSMISALMSGNDMAISDVRDVQLSLLKLGETHINVRDKFAQNKYLLLVDTLQVERALQMIDLLRQGLTGSQAWRILVTPSGMGSGRPMANGGIVNGPQFPLVGEAGPEVIIPLTRPQRAMELMRQTGLDSMVGMRASSGPAVSIANANFYDGTDANLVAQKVNAAERARSFAS